MFECEKLHDGKIYLPTLDVIVTEKCTLRCRDCSNLMQYYEKPKSYPSYDLVKSLLRLHGLVERVGDLHILGGEPFLYPELTELLDGLEHARDKIGRVKVLTNGTIVPKYRVLDALYANNVFVSISDYGKKSWQLAPLVRALDKAGIEYEVKKIAFWQKCGYVSLEAAEPEVLADRYAGCCAKDLLTLHDGRLFLCPFASNAVKLGMIPHDGEYSLPVETCTREMLHEFLSVSGDKSGICAHCPGRGFGQDRVNPAIQTARLVGKSGREQCGVQN